MREIYSQTLWILVARSEQVAGQWVAHCLALDIVSQGDSIAHAFEMASEAVLECVKSDIEHDLNPSDRQPAPEKEWEPLFKLLKTGRPLDAIPAEETDQISVVAGQLRVTVRCEDHTTHEKLSLIPPAWQVAALEALRSSNRLSTH